MIENTGKFEIIFNKENYDFFKNFPKERINNDINRILNIYVENSKLSLMEDLDQVRFIYEFSFYTTSIKEIIKDVLEKKEYHENILKQKNIMIRKIKIKSVNYNGIALIIPVASDFAQNKKQIKTNKTCVTINHPLPVYGKTTRCIILDCKKLVNIYK